MMSEDRRHKNKQNIASLKWVMRYLLTPPLVNVFTNGSVQQSVATAAAVTRRTPVAEGND